MRLTWAEVWADLEPITRKALNGESTFIEDFLVRINRHGEFEDSYFTFCYSPVCDEHGAVAGMLDTVVETTAKVLAERQAREEAERQQALLQQMPGFVGALSGPVGLAWWHERPSGGGRRPRRPPGPEGLFITGYAETAVMRGDHLDHGIQVMTKPFELDALADRVRH